MCQCNEINIFKRTNCNGVRISNECSGQADSMHYTVEKGILYMIDDFLSVHANALKLRSQRTHILASNIANSDTPNYKARDLAFAEVLRDVSGPGNTQKQQLPLSSDGLDLTHHRHLQIRQIGHAAQVLYRQPQGASLDGNTVDKDQEQARFAENTIRYQASIEFIKSRVSGLIKALRSE